MKLSVVLAVSALLAAPALAQAAAPIDIVSAENFYGDVAKQIGGPNVESDEHPEQPGRGPASVRGESVRRQGDLGGAHRGLQRHRL